MASTSQPIALPLNNSHNADYTMAEGSYTGSSGFFNPASYTRHFLGSPISWPAGSFGVGSFGGGRFPMGSPTAQLLSSIDPNEFRAGKTPSSTDGSILNALNVFDRDRELCQNYTCCGLQLNDLHALLEHFEEVHIVVLDPTAPQPQAHIQIPFYPQSYDSDPSTSHHNNKPTPCPPYHQQRNQQQPYPAPFDADDMELELDLDNSTQPPPPPTPSQSSSHSSPSSGAPSPPDTPISTPLSAYPSPHAFIPHHLPQHSHVSAYISQPSSPLSTYDNSVSSTRHSSPTASTQRPNLNLNLSSFPRSHLNSPALVPNPEEVFNPYARFSSDYSSCMPGAQFNGANVDEASALHGVSPTQWQEQQNQQNQGQCVPPALLFSSSASVTPSSTPGGSRVPSPTTTYHHSLAAAAQSPISSVPASPAPLSKSHTAPNSGASTPVRTSSSSAVAGATLSRPGSSLLLSKPFRCPKPNCNKSYKQANGLKYHMTHGSCNFAPPKDLEHVKDLLERKRRDKEREAGLTRSASCGSALAPPLNDGAPNEVMNEQGVLTYGELGNISETELREVEKEAEKRLRPFACGVGDCQRRYKNMNGLRYHYQHSGDHGAVGLALLASGQHECLLHGAQKRQQLQQGGGGTEAEREGRKRFLGGGKGSASVPVSRAGSASRTGTPSLPPVTVHYSTQTGVPPTTAMTTPIQATPVQPFPSTVNGNGNGVVSTPASPTFTAQQQQQQQQMAYQYAHVHAQMQRQYAVMQQQQAQVQAQQQAQVQAQQQAQQAQQAQQQAQVQAQQQAQIAHQVHMQSSSPHMHVASPHHQQQQVHSPHSPSRSRYSHSPRHSHSSSQGSDSSYCEGQQGFGDQQQQQQQNFVDQQAQQQNYVDQQQQQNFVDQQQQQNFVDQTQAQQQQHFTDTHFAALYAQHQQQLYAAAAASGGHAMDMS